MFRFLKYGLAVILTFIGVKMVIGQNEAWHISSPTSLAIVGGVLVIAVLASLLLPEKKEVEKTAE
jgi:tellurite resistance protein TerC